MRRLLAALTATFAVVVATGVHQAIAYHPGGSQGWSDVHRFASVVLMVLLLVVLFVWLRERARLRKGVVQVLALVVATVAVVAALITGPTIQWDQLAFFEVSGGGADIEGVFDTDALAFVLADGQEHTAETFRRSVWAHVVILPVVFAIALTAVWYLSRRAPAGTAHGHELEVTA
jgi:hypothetical protein